MTSRRLKDFRGQGNDTHVITIAQLTGYGTKDAGTPGFVLVSEEDYGIVIETDVRTVLATDLLFGPYDDGLGDRTFLDASRGGVLDRDYDLVTDRCITPFGPSEHTDTEDLLGPTVICNP